MGNEFFNLYLYPKRLIVNKVELILVIRSKFSIETHAETLDASLPLGSFDALATSRDIKLTLNAAPTGIGSNWNLKPDSYTEMHS